MNTCTKLTSLLLALVAGVSYAAESSSSQSDKTLDKAPIVGKYVQVGDNKVLSCDQKLLTDTIRLPLSLFTEELEIIKLDHRDEALVKEAKVTVSDNYMLVHSGYPPTAYKLFDRKGKFLTDIGSVGQGPGEYKNVYDVQLDEANNRIYLMPWQSQKILVYDLKGNILDPIPMPIRCPKAKFRVDTKKGTVSVVLLAFKGIPSVAWTQDLKGNQLKKVETGHLEAPQDFSNEVDASYNVSGIFDVNLLFIMPTRVDSLYRYDVTKGQLIPTFTLNFKDTNKIPWHSYYEWPNHFAGNISAPPVEVAPGQWVNGENFYYIVDKKTGKGSFFKLYNDYLGNAEISWPVYSFSNGYYVKNIEPGNLLNEIEKALKNKGLSDSMRKKLTNLQNSINDNDNNYIMIAKLRK